MNLFEQIGREAILLALFTGQTRMESQSYETGARDQQGNPIFAQRWTSVPADSVVVSLINGYFSGRYDSTPEEKAAVNADRSAIVRTAVEYLKAHPELLAGQLAKVAAAELFATKRGSYGSADTLVQSELLRSILRETAAGILKEDQPFRDRVLDMANMSDSDRIHVSVELKPGGGNAK